MPFRSKAQRAYLYAKLPGVAKEFQSKTPKNQKLPQHAGVKGEIAKKLTK